ncbi:hypothetical protein BH11PSE14_BH11PSE14_13110 [soil metagenome]
MSKAGSIFLLVALAAIAFFLGTRWHPAQAPAGADAPSAEITAVQERAISEAPASQPVRTFRGPDGRPHLINYETGKTLDDHDIALVRGAVLEDMRNHPNNISGAYDIPMADIQLIVSGSKPFPDQLLPETEAAQPR